MSNDMRGVLAMAVWILALGLVGPDEYAEAKRHEQINCERNPAPEWCADDR